MLFTTYATGYKGQAYDLTPGFDRWQDQIRRTGGCSDPIHLTGGTVTRDRATGEVLHHYSTDTEAGSSGSPVFNDQWEVVALHHSVKP